ncbi:MAG TPA: ABC transporter ATP-binding protein [Firmicutes bacterium]|nr:ABC transporter ATP-binding protein [Bacillota bacterium]
MVGPGSVCVQDVSFTYQQATEESLRRFSLDIAPGEFVLVAGPSGSGKSTLAMCLTGFVPHYFPGRFQGSVRVGDLDTLRCDVYRLAQEIGLVQQDPEGQLCTLRVEDEVAFGPENLCLHGEEVRRRVGWALQAAGAAHLRGRGTAALSGGEKQKVAIAAMLAMGCHTLVLDEPTSSLDPRSTREVFEAISSLRGGNGPTVLVIEHRLHHFLPLASRLVVVREGEKAADVPAAAVSAAFTGSDGWPSGSGPLTSGPPTHGLLTPEPVTPGPVTLAVRDLDFRWPDPEGITSTGAAGSTAIRGSRVLRGVSFDLRAGEITVLMGDNGSGKSTLLGLILGFYRPQGGNVFLHGRDITGEPVARRARRIGLVFQNPHHQIFERTVRDEVLLPARNFGHDEETAWKQAQEILEGMGLLGYSAAHPLALSFGQKKRLNLATMLTYRPDVLLLDEPFAGQDEVAVQVVMDVLYGFCRQGGTVLLVCHEPSLVPRYCHRVLFLEGGEVTVDAAPPQAFALLRKRGRTEYCPPEPGRLPG